MSGCGCKSIFLFFKLTQHYRLQASGDFSGPLLLVNKAMDWAEFMDFTDERFKLHSTIVMKVIVVMNQGGDQIVQLHEFVINK